MAGAADQPQTQHRSPDDCPDGEFRGAAHDVGTPASAERRRLPPALLVSLLIHALLLSLTFGREGLGLPGFGLPWQERRVEAPELSVVLMPARAPDVAPALVSVTEPLPQSSIEQPVADGLALTLSGPPAPTLGLAAEVIAPTSQPTARAKPSPDAPTGAAPVPIPEPTVIAMERSDDTTLLVPVAPVVPTPVIAAAPSASSPETVLLAPRDAGDAARELADAVARERAVELARLDRLEREVQRQAALMEAARIETVRQALERQEAARQEAVRQDAQRAENTRLEAERQAATQQVAGRHEAARRDAQRVEIARLEAERQEAARQAALRQELTRQELARLEARRIETARLETDRQEAARRLASRQDATRQEAARQDAQRVETARLEAERQDAARQAAARQELMRQAAARVEAAQAEEARREAVLRAIGRQLDEEAAKRDAAAGAVATAAGLPAQLPPAASSVRRGRLFGRTDANAELILYAEAWARKIQLNMGLESVRDALKRPHADPVVTVAVRSDGSVESVVFVVSSGVADLDDAIRRIVQSQWPYPAFPPGLAREFDVIEIRRTWHFDTAIRLY